MYKYSTILIITLALAVLNIERLHSGMLGAAVALAYGGYASMHLGRTLMPGWNRLWQRIAGTLGVLSLFIISATGLYYAFGLQNQTIYIALFITAAGIPLIQKFHITHDIQSAPPSQDSNDVPLVTPHALRAWILALISIIGDALLLEYLVRHGTLASIRTPWSVVSYKFFILFGITSFTLLRALSHETSRRFGTFALTLHAAVMLGVGYGIYRLGFGFDPFLHRAAETHISEWGILTPLTPFYIGQYVLVVALHKLTYISIAAIDKLLLPVLEILYLPPLVYLLARRGLGFTRADARTSALLFFLMPFASFVATTPYELSAFFALITMTFSFLHVYTRTSLSTPIIICALSALAIHPLAGIPSVLIAVPALIAGARAYKPRIRTVLAYAAVGISAVALPSVFLIYLSYTMHAWGAAPSFDTLISRLPHLMFPAPRAGETAHLLYTPLYWYYFLSPFLYAALAWYGYAAWRARLDAHTRAYAVLFPALYLAMVCNAFLLRLFIRLPGIGDHEQFQYSDRIMHFAAYLLMPFFLYGIAALIAWIEKKYRRVPVRLILSIMCAALLTASLYASYPRVDAYELSRFINTSQTDVHTVHAIDADAHGAPYVVLSNISVAAAALQEFGFVKTAAPAYFNTSQGQLFYYSIPTGGPLYSAYLKMAEHNPDRATADEVAHLTGVGRVYLALDEYWYTFQKITPQAQLAADRWFPVDGGKAEVFVYILK